MRIGRYCEILQYKKETMKLEGENYVDFLHDLEKEGIMNIYLEEKIKSA